MVLAITKSYESSNNYNYADNIYIIQQFYIPSNPKRRAEVNDCLKRNADLQQISKIYLLGEKEYSKKELGLNDKQFSKISQHVIGHRMKYIDVFKFTQEEKLKGYIIFMNSDIFLDKTVDNIYKTPLASEKTFMAQLRFEFNPSNKHLQLNKLFVNWITYSQDTWIYHTNYQPEKSKLHIFDFEFGKPGCDNKITYLMSVLGFEIINDPNFIKSYHVHNTNIRNYSSSDRIKKPYEIVIPQYYLKGTQALYGIDVNILFGKKFNHKDSNIKLNSYIKNKIISNSNFIIPRVAGVENDYAIYTLMVNLQSASSDMITYLKNYITKIKNNAGIFLSSNDSLKKYSKLYLEAFKLCDLYSSWAPFDDVFRTINTSHTILNNIYSDKDTVYSEVFDIYHYIFSNPWTHALKGKRVLMISQFEDSIKEKINIRKEIYGIDLFPECEILTIKPPQTQGQEPSEDFEIELKKFTDKLDLIKDTYDVALVSCGGYGNLVCAHIYKSGNSAIYVGGVLQMFWGILGTRWFENRPDIIRLFLNKHWSRPKESEKPLNHNSIENSCYW